MMLRVTRSQSRLELYLCYLFCVDSLSRPKWTSEVKRNGDLREILGVSLYFMLVVSLDGR